MTPSVLWHPSRGNRRYSRALVSVRARRYWPQRNLAILRRMAFPRSSENDIANWPPSSVGHGWLWSEVSACSFSHRAFSVFILRSCAVRLPKGPHLHGNKLLIPPLLSVTEMTMVQPKVSNHNIHHWLGLRWRPENSAWKPCQKYFCPVSSYRRGS